jgi:hypothetical protein
MYVAVHIYIYMEKYYYYIVLESEMIKLLKRISRLKLETDLKSV